MEDGRSGWSGRCGPSRSRIRRSERRQGTEVDVECAHGRPALAGAPADRARRPGHGGMAASFSTMISEGRSRPVAEEAASSTRQTPPRVEAGGDQADHDAVIGFGVDRLALDDQSRARDGLVRLVPPRAHEHDVARCWMSVAASARPSSRRSSHSSARKALASRVLSCPRTSSASRASRARNSGEARSNAHSCTSRSALAALAAAIVQHLLGRADRAMRGLSCSVACYHFRKAKGKKAAAGV